MLSNLKSKNLTYLKREKNSFKADFTIKNNSTRNFFSDGFFWFKLILFSIFTCGAEMRIHIRNTELDPPSY